MNWCMNSEYVNEMIKKSPRKLVYFVAFDSIWIILVGECVCVSVGHHRNSLALLFSAINFLVAFPLLLVVPETQHHHRMALG